ncbi:MAG: hypothetical protein CVT62_11445 [Actinobacteria bacterium HGW-Actinobacteria-2]|nr:MAG: hypothetical protein CVT62_11445 [Actinobacteria bacterium HGW-Actinobacteria-2]
MSSSTPNTTTAGSRVRRGLATVAISVALIGIAPPIVASAAPPVTFADSHVEAAVRTALHISSPTPVTTDDMLALTSLSVGSPSVTSLGGLEAATNLTTLDAGSNPALTSIQPIAGLTKLTYLNIGWCDVQSYEPLTGLTNLETLYASHNVDITDLSALGGLTKLTSLSIAQLAATSLEPLSDLTGLTYLDAGYLAVTDLSPLAGLTELTSLNLYSSGTLSNLTPLAAHTKLTWANFSDAEVYDLTGLENLNAGGTIHLHSDYLDLTPGSPASQIVDTLRSRGYTVNVTPQKVGGVLSGTVTDASGTPLAGVTVALTDGPRTITDVTGGYTIGLAKQRHWTVGFSKAAYTATSTTADVWIGSTTTVDAVLSPLPGTISGTVSSGGTGVGGVTVSLDGSPATITAPDGSYTLPAAAGGHTLTFTKAYYLNATASPTVPAGSGATAHVTLTPVQLSQTITRSPQKATITAKRKRGKATVILRATFTDARGAIAGQTVQLQRSTNGKTKWKSVNTRRTDLTGTASVTITTRKRQTVYYRWFTATTAADLTKTSGKQKVKIR